MKTILFVILICFSYAALGQEQMTEEEWEGNKEEEKFEEDNETILLRQQFKSHPININTAEEEQLNALGILNALQLTNFFQYRKLLGAFIDIFELQAIPAWDIITIRKIIPYLTITSNESVQQLFSNALKNGEQSLLIRSSRGWINDEQNHSYKGSMDKLLIKYKFNYKGAVQFGLTAEKDAGEPMFAAKTKSGFDFYSIHFFIRKKGLIRTIAIGDYIVNIGQGLIRWQNFSFGKTGEVLNIKKQSETIKPFQSSSEFNFNRGLAIQLKKDRWDISLFASLRKLSGNAAFDSSGNYMFITSINESGYHRTASELIDKNNLSLFSSGFAVRFTGEGFRVGFNAVIDKFSLPVIKDSLPYNLFAFRGKLLANQSVDYSGSFKNFHLFGETAIDRNKSMATINGCIISINRYLDASFLYRNISASYQSFFSDAFTEQSKPVNETGLYAGISAKLNSRWIFQSYTDIFKKGWLSFDSDAPSAGSDQLLQVIYQPNKNTTISFRWRSREGSKSFSDDGPASQQAGLSKTNWRWQFCTNSSRKFGWKLRVEYVTYQVTKREKETGFMAFTELNYELPSRGMSFNGRLLFFETDSYEARLFDVESDGLAGSAMLPVFYAGYRWYLNTKININRVFQIRKKIDIKFFIKLAQTVDLHQLKNSCFIDEQRVKDRFEMKYQVLLGF